VDRRGRAIVLMPGPYDKFCKKVNGINTDDVFGSHNPAYPCWVLEVQIVPVLYCSRRIDLTNTLVTNINASFDFK
jgi:hypothetical protein